MKRKSLVTSTTSGGTLDVKLEPSPKPIKSGQETDYKYRYQCRYCEIC